MEYILIAIVSLLVAGLTFFSGFGLGTLLLPAFAIFFPIEIAVASTAIVHLANNIFKIFLVGKNADKKILMLFAVPASMAAFFGASLLNYFSGIAAISEWHYGENIFYIEPIKLTIAALMILFAIIELTPALNKISFKEKYIPFGGILSGFFGGLSGHQGALRSAFLIRTNLSKEALIGTMVAAAVVIDVSRLLVYGSTFISSHFAQISTGENALAILAGTISAFIGSYFGAKMIKKVTLKGIQKIVAFALIILGLLLGLGIV